MFSATVLGLVIFHTGISYTYQD